MFFARWLTICLLALSPATLTGNIHQPEDVDLWTKLELEEAFVSRWTTTHFVDGFGAPEFGWRIRRQERTLARGGLYTTLYYPGGPDAAVELHLVELDLLRDDLVAVTQLHPGLNRYAMGQHGDFALIKRSPFVPDANSGSDRRPAGAGRLGNGMTATLSFLDGDYTDYLRIAANRTALIASDMPALTLDSMSTETSVHPDGPARRDVLIIEAGAESLLRLRGPIAHGRIEYRAIVVAVAGGKQALLQATLAKCDQDEWWRRGLRPYDLGRRLAEWAPEEVQAVCQRTPPNEAPQRREFCRPFRQSRQ